MDKSNQTKIITEKLLIFRESTESSFVSACERVTNFEQHPPFNLGKKWELSNIIFFSFYSQKKKNKLKTDKDF